jgi:hypothetical protein
VPGWLLWGLVGLALVGLVVLILAIKHYPEDGSF